MSARPRVFGMISTILSTDYTWYALDTFFRHTPLRAEDRFLLIDNDVGSVDEARLKRDFPAAELLSNPSPRGFATNMNQILRAASDAEADAFLLNNDIIFSPGWLNGMLLDQPWILSACCNMQFQYRTAEIELKLSMNLEDYVGREAAFLALVEYHRKRVSGYQLIHSVPYYCVKVPPEVYRNVGFLDESFGEAFWEDTDYLLRAWERGYPTLFALDAFVIHFYGKSTWRAEVPENLKHREPSKSKAGETAFRKKWGEEIAQAFGFQSPEGLRALRVAEQSALAACYASFVRSRKPKVPG
ncbi:MAG: hypothetical protein U0136_06865 [Bdellovibrionota bacterium]